MPSSADGKSGWMAYLMRNDLLFVEGWPTYPKRPYNEGLV